MHELLGLLKKLTTPEGLGAMAQQMGSTLYVVLFVIVFAETGLVVTPFLPGDSLLFAIGALTSTGGINLAIVVPLLIVAAIVGDALNYQIGLRVGPAVFKSEKSRLFNKAHLERTQRFYEKYGGKTIIIARFVPIVRTFAPFVAGVGAMKYSRFFQYNVVGAVIWVVSLTLLGYGLGSIEFVKKRFELVVFAIIIISVLPAVIEYVRERGKKPEPKDSPTA